MQIAIKLSLVFTFHLSPILYDYRFNAGTAYVESNIYVYSIKENILEIISLISVYRRRDRKISFSPLLFPSNEIKPYSS